MSYDTSKSRCDAQIPCARVLPNPLLHKRRSLVEITTRAQNIRASMGAISVVGKPTGYLVSRTDGALVPGHFASCIISTPAI